jgi:hypothetical protein
VRTHVIYRAREAFHSAHFPPADGVALLALLQGVSSGRLETGVQQKRADLVYLLQARPM